MNKLFASFIMLVLGAGLGYYAARYIKCPIKNVCDVLNEKHCALRRGLDKLWADHVIWTRQFIVSKLANLQDIDFALKRLLKNQEDIGNAIIPFYGQDAGNALTKLLKEHISIAGDIVNAAIEKNDQQVKDLDSKWHENAKEIAVFLSNANPNWTNEEWTDMLNTHLALTTKELEYRLKGDWQADVDNFDQIFDQARDMGKSLADGISKEFPDKF